MQPASFVSASRWLRRQGASAFQSLLLITFFLFAGVLGHGPWKQDEPYIFGIVSHFVATGQWLVPMNAGAPFMEKPPLYYWTAAITGRLTQSFLPLYDGARLASVFYMALACVFQWRTARVLFASDRLRNMLPATAVFLMLGSLGLVRFSHEMVTDIPLLAGTTMALLGISMMTMTRERPYAAGLWLGLGMGISFLAKGLFMVGVLGLTGLALMALLPGLRGRVTFIALGIAAITSLPFLTIWPALLYQYSPALFEEWFWQNNIGRFAGFSVARLGADNSPLYFLWVTPFFAFPALPLALAARRRSWRSPAVLVPGLLVGVGVTTLLLSASGRAQYLLPLLPGVALLGAQGLAGLPGRWLSRWNRSTTWLFGGVLLLLWLIWAALAFPQDLPRLHHAARPLGIWLPLEFAARNDRVAAYGFALLVTLYWMYGMRRFASDTYHDTARRWLLCATAAWGVTFTLLLPWIDVTRSYDTVFAAMTDAAEKIAAPGDCIESANLGESVGPLYEYYRNSHSGNILPSPLCPVPKPNGCAFLLIKTERNAPDTPGLKWRVVWKGSRPLDAKNEQLRLYRKYRKTG